RLSRTRQCSRRRGCSSRRTLFRLQTFGAVQGRVTDVDMAHNDCHQLCADAIAQAGTPRSRVPGGTDRGGTEVFRVRTTGALRIESRRRVPTFRIQYTPKTSGGTALASVAQDIPVAGDRWSEHERSSTRPWSSRGNRE